MDKSSRSLTNYLSAVQLESDTATDALNINDLPNSTEFEVQSKYWTRDVAHSRSSVASSATTAHVALGQCPFETTFVNKARRFPMYGGDRRPLLNTEYRTVDTLQAKDDNRLTGEVELLYHRLLPNSDEVHRKQQFICKLESLLNQEWPGKDFTVHAFGSTENMLATCSSDLDVCIETEWTGFAHRICELSRFMHRCGMQNVVCRAQAKVPVVAIYDPELRVTCDMNINNTLALRNTRLVKTYMQMDVRARQLTFAVKQWAAQRALNEAVCNTLTSYTWTLMVISYLQTRKTAPVLPSLQEWPHEPMPPIEGIDVSFADDLVKYDTLQTFSMQNAESVGTLLFGFFHYYAYEFNYSTSVASVRTGRVLHRREKGYPSDNMFCIEEPFTTTRNLGNTADMGSHRGIHAELQRAHKLLALGELLETVFAKFEPADHGSSESDRPWKRNNTTGNPRQRTLRNNVSRQHYHAQPGTSSRGYQSPQVNSKSMPPAHITREYLAHLLSINTGRLLDQQYGQNQELSHWHNVNRTDHAVLPAGINPYLYQPQAPQSSALSRSDSRQPERMQRAKSQPLGTNGVKVSTDFRRHSHSQADMAATQRKLPNQIPMLMEHVSNSAQNSSGSSQGVLQFSETFSDKHLAQALGLSRIELITRDSRLDDTAHTTHSGVSHGDLLSYDKTYIPSSTLSDAGDSLVSAGLTLASSRSSPVSLSGYPSPNQLTYAQVSSNTTENYLRTPPVLNLNSVTDATGTISSHFPRPRASTADTTATSSTSPRQGLPVSYAAKVSNSPPSASNGIYKRGSYVPRATVQSSMHSNVKAHKSIKS